MSSLTSPPVCYDDPCAEIDSLFNEALSTRNVSAPMRQESQRRSGSQVARVWLECAPTSRKNSRPELIVRSCRMNVHQDARTGVESLRDVRRAWREEGWREHRHSQQPHYRFRWPTEHDENGYAVHERQCRKFSRTLQLPTGINVSACYRGVEIA